MSAINGKWKLHSTENMEDFYTATKASEEYKETSRQLGAAKKTNPESNWEEFHVDPEQGTLRRTIYIKDSDKIEIIFKFGVVKEITTSDGRDMKVTLTHVSDDKVTVHEDGPGFQVDGFIEANANELTLNLASGGVTSAQNYRRIA